MRIQDRIQEMEERTALLEEAETLTKRLIFALGASDDVTEDEQATVEHFITLAMEMAWNRGHYAGVKEGESKLHLEN